MSKILESICVLWI